MSSVEKLPVRVTVDALLSSRYPDGLRPDSWDDRVAGNDLIKAGGKTIKLRSDGGQSPPQPGWVILLTEGDGSSGYLWTLYGIPKGCETHTY